MVTGQKLRDNKPPRIFEEIIAKYAADAILFRLGSTNPKKKFQSLEDFFLFELFQSNWVSVGGAQTLGI